jgi:hypothetical protein
VVRGEGAHEVAIGRQSPPETVRNSLACQNYGAWRRAEGLVAAFLFRKRQQSTESRLLPRFRRHLGQGPRRAATDHAFFVSANRMQQARDIGKTLLDHGREH